MNLVKAKEIVYQAGHTRCYLSDDNFFNALKICAHSASFILHLRRDKVSPACKLFPGETKD